MRSLAFLILLAACDAADPPAPPAAPTAATPPAAPAPPPAAPAAPAASAPAGDDLLTPAGLGDLAIGDPPPLTGALALEEDNVRLSDDCRTYRRDSLAGVYVMTDGDRIRRITVMRDAPVRTAAGIGPGATEAEVRRAYPDLDESPHEYVGPPGKNLVAREAGSGAALRFEIGEDGRVTLVHAGESPWLDYSEGCA